ncbi:MAG: hypothetical protein FD126_1913 [Elusimicrobia bacterium]|nr:MAG: hypothetical protein FD126_1913 [Elusimicrobiota bacterium]
MGTAVQLQLMEVALKAEPDSVPGGLGKVVNAPVRAAVKVVPTVSGSEARPLKARTLTE